MSELPGYTLAETLRQDGGLVLRRGRSDAERSTVLVLTTALANVPPQIVALLEHEYELRAELDSQWAAQPLALAHHDGRTALILSDPGGEPLERLLGRPLAPLQFLRLAIGLAGAVDRLHGRGLMHKDLKPVNILVAPDGERVWLTGFGIASRLPHERQGPDPPEVIAGTLAYMAPEQTGRMNRSIDTRSDLYAVGVTCYRMLTGVLPCTGEDAMGWMHCQVAHEPTPPAALTPGVPDAVSAIVMKLLAKAAEERYQTAAGLAADLRRCLGEWQAGGQIAPFALGAEDRSERLQIPEKLYGRETELRRLVDAFERVRTRGTPELMLVGGYAGVGKSSLVLELQRSLLPAGGLFAAGKVDQYQRDIPYATVAEALRTLVRQLLVTREDELAAWRTAILAAVGASGRLVVDLVPELELIIGKPPKVVELAPREAENRYLAVLTRFVGLFARREHPLLLFLDDLQWLDAATLKLLAYLVTQPNTGYLLAVGAYRDNEVGPDHPLRLSLETMRQAGAVVHEIAVAPLGVAELGRFVAAALNCEPADVEALAQLVHEKTAGNPFFAIQLLNALWEEGLLVFDRTAAAWTWDVEQLRAKDYADNVVEMMARKVEHLPAGARDTLGQLACLGSRADAALLSRVCGRSAQQTETDVWPALEAGLVLREDVHYRFVHDRVHEAAYALIPAERRAAEHLRIGRLLLAQPQRATGAEWIFAVANQFNRSVHLVTDPHEKETLRDLNACAGRQAKAVVAHACAANYLAQALALLPPDAWSARYAETFSLHLERSECEYLVGNFPVADALFERLLANAHGDLDRARVYRLRSRLYQATGRFAEAMKLILDGLRLFGVTLPDADDALQAACAAEMDAIRARLEGKDVAALADAPAATDETAMLLISLLVEGLGPAYAASPSHFSLLAAKAVSCSLRHGNTVDSCTAYSSYALALIAVRGDIATAYEFSELALALVDKFDDPRQRGLVLACHGGLVLPWRGHIAGGLPFIERGLAALLDVGDFLDAAYLTMLASWAVVEQGKPLAEVQQAAEKYAALTREIHNEMATETLQLYLQLVASLAGRTRAPGSFDDAGFSEAACLARFTRAGWQTGIAYYHVMKQVAAYIYGQYAEALEASARAEPLLRQMMAMPVAATHYFYHALTLAALYREAPAQQQQAFAQTLAAHSAELKRWADHCPENFANRYTLVAAEVARIEGRELDAEHLYEQAIAAAHAQGFIQNEALANELAAGFHRQRGFSPLADGYLRKARYGYLRWGATGKVQALDARSPELAEPQPLRSGATIGTPVEQLDLVAVVKASQAVSGEIVLTRLIETLMRIALEHAGAERGLLILSRGGALWIAAEASSAGHGKPVAVKVAPEAPPLPPSAAELPESLLRYVLRTHEKLILDDAAAPNLFSADAYLSSQGAGKPLRSVLCIPLLRQTALVGVLYLENRLTPGAFTPRRVAVLELLASQAAISLENARYYGDLARENAERKRAEEALSASRARFAAILGSALEAIVTIDVDQRIVYFNAAAERLFGWPAAEAIGRPLDRIIPARFRAAHREHVRKFAANGTTQRLMGEPLEVYGLRTNGEEFPLDAAISQVDSGGQKLLTVMLRDITERKRADQELRRHREHLEELVTERTAELTTLKEHLATELADLKRLHRLSTRLVAENEPAALLHEVLQASIELLGADKGKLQLYDKQNDVLRIVAQFGFNQAFIDTFSTVPPFSAICGTALGLQERVIVENALTDPRFTEDRELYAANDVLAMQSTPLYGSDGQLYGVLTTHFRLPHRPAERELRLLDLYAQQATRVIENTERAAQLALAKRRAEEADRLKSAFLTTMSHELRTPLNAILGYAQILARAPSLDERQAEGVNTIRQSGEYLLTLINGILDLSKIEAGRFELSPAPVKLALFLQGVAEIIAVKAEEKGLRFAFEASPDLPEVVSFDERRLRQVLLNLLGNAVRFTDRGQVTLRVHSLPGDDAQVRLRFEIQDSGVGIAADQLDIIFQPFEQAGAIRNRSGGTGLGLAISRQLVRLMDSDIHAESQLDQGSRFWFELALPLAGDAEVAARPEKRAVTGYRGKRRKLLIVDDVVANRTMLADLLSSLGFDTCEAGDGPEAVAQAQAQHPDLILMDVTMPQMDGPEAIRRIRELPGFGALPVLAVSASTSSEDEARSLAAGACAFITKPIDHPLLLDVIGSELSMDWIEAPPPVAASTGPLLAPPPAEMEILRQLALTGSMRDIRQRGDHLKALDPRYGPFADRLRDLARRYQSQAILALVEQYLKEPESS